MNHREITIAPSTSAAIPVPPPTTMPQSSTSWAGVEMRVAAAVPTASRASAAAIVRRTPNRSARAAQNGPVSP